MSFAFFPIPLYPATYYLLLLSPHTFLTSFPVVQQPCSANIDTNTGTPTHPFQAYPYLLSSPQPLIVSFIPDIPHHSYLHSMLFYNCDRGRKFVQNGGKVIASFHFYTYSSFILSLNIVTSSVEILLWNELRNNKCHNWSCYEPELAHSMNCFLQSVHHYDLSCCSKWNCTKTSFCPHLILRMRESLTWPTD